MAKGQVRFYRGKNPTVVWDARNDRALCDLSNGHITTRDEYTIKVLRSLKYIEIPLDATQPPPPGYEAEQPLKTEDVKTVPMGMGEAGVAKLQSTESEDEVESEDEHGPVVPAPKPKKSTAAKPKNTPSDKPKKSRAPLKRRGGKK